MKNILDKIEQFSGKVSQNTYVSAIRDAFVTIIPFLVLGGVLTFIDWILLPSKFMTNILSAETITSIQTMFSQTTTASMGLMTMMTVILLGYNIAKFKKHENPIIVALVALSCFIIGTPIVDSAIPTTWLGSNGMFEGLMFGIISSVIFLKVAENDKLKIKVSGNVPGAIVSTFNNMFAIIITLLIVTFITYGIKFASGKEIAELINTTLQAPLVNITATLPGMIVNVLLQNLVFFFGIHPAGVTNPVFNTPLTIALTQNAEAIAQGLAPTNICNLAFRDVYTTLGGSGATLGLLICMLFFSKRNEVKEIAKVAAPVSIFNINEPVLFGLPVVYNFVMLIPFVAVSVINVIIAYLATAAHLVSVLSVYVTWSTPIGFSAFLASAGDFRNVILQLLLVVLDALIWFPFLKMYEKQLEKQAESDEA